LIEFAVLKLSQLENGIYEELKNRVFTRLLKIQGSTLIFRLARRK
jgi:hypothetical protein